MGMFPYEKYDKIRQEKGWLNYKVALAIGIVPSNMTFWKQGKNEPKYDKIVKIAKLFDVPVEDLIADKEEADV